MGVARRVNRGEPSSTARIKAEKAVGLACVVELARVLGAQRRHERAGPFAIGLARLPEKGAAKRVATRVPIVDDHVRVLDYKKAVAREAAALRSAPAY